MGRWAALRTHRVTLFDAAGPRAGRQPGSARHARGAADLSSALPEVKAALAGRTGVDIRSDPAEPARIWVAVPGTAGGARRKRSGCAGACRGPLAARDPVRGAPRPRPRQRACAGRRPGHRGAAGPDGDGGARDSHRAAAAISALGTLRDRSAEHGAPADAAGAVRPLRNAAPVGAESSALVDAMVEGVLASDERGRIVTANPAARRLLGYDETETHARPAPVSSGSRRRARWWMRRCAVTRCRIASSTSTAASSW